MKAHSGWIACCSAYEALNTGNEEWLIYFTKRICYLPSSYWSLVGESLWLESWHDARHPTSYVKKVAQTLAYKECSGLFSRGFQQYPTEKMHRVPMCHNHDIKTFERILCIEQKCRNLDISPNATKLEAIKVVEGLSYAQAGKIIGFSPKQVAAYRREICRKKTRS